MKKEGKETIYDVRYFDNRLPAKDRCVKTGHQTLGQAQMFAIKKSEEFGYAAVAETLQYNVGEVPQEDIVRKWGYLNGQEVDVNVDFEAEKQKWIAAAHKKLAKLKSETEKENTMNTVTSADVTKATKGKLVTKVTPAAAKGAGKGAVAAAGKAAKASAPKAAKANGKASKKPDTGPKSVKAPVGKPGSLLASFGLREGSKKAAVVQLLCENVGKMLAVKDVLKAGYGSQNIENIGALRMVLAGAEENMRTNKIDYYLARGKDAKDDLTLGLKKGKAPKE